MPALERAMRASRRVTVNGSGTDLFALLQAALEPQYRLERELGRGGMGVVFQATDRTLHRRVAVKVVHPELAAHPTIAQRFLAEARMLARIRHPNIVAVHHAGRAGSLPFYVMDEVPGESLRHRLNREGPLPVGTVQTVVADIAAALDAAGRAGFVHRDVKPENVLLDSATGRALLADFGIARHSDPESAPDVAVSTGQGIAVGTPTYMSPEQAAGEAVDARSDLYALGVVAYEALAGQPPFIGPNRVVVSRHISERPAPIERLRPDTPLPLADAVMRALEKQPEDRWQSGEAFRAALLAHAPAPRSGRRPLRRAALAAAALVLLAAGGFFGFARLRSDRPPAGVDPRRSMLVLPFANLRDDRALDWLRDGSVSMLGLNLSQWNDLAVVDHERVHDLLAHGGIKPGESIGLEQARRLARDAGAWTVVIGEFSRAADSLHLVARVYDVASGARVEVARADGPAHDDVRPLFDALAARLLDLSGAPSDVRTGLAQSTTASLEAYRAYLSGVELLNRWQLSDAQRELERAVALDSTFSLAYFKLALTLGWTGGTADSLTRTVMARAVRSMGKLPLHEQQVMNAYQAFLSEDYSTARELYQRLIARDASDRDAWYGLGEAWFHDMHTPDYAVNLTESYRAFERALAIDPGYTLPYYHVHDMLKLASRSRPFYALVSRDSFVAVGPLAAGVRLDSATREAAVRRARQAALTHARGWVAAEPAAKNAHEALVDAYTAVQDFSAARAEMDRFRGTVPSYPELPFTEARVRFAAGEPERAAAELRRAVDSLSAKDFDSTSLSWVAVNTVSAGANVFAYLGDLDYATRVIDLANALQRRLMAVTHRPTSPRWATNMDWRMRGELYSAVGGPPGSLRRIWESAADAGRSVPAPDRASVVNSAGAAAVGLLASPVADTTAVVELARLSGQQPAREVRALLALSRGDTVEARRILAEPMTSIEESKGYVVFTRPLAAQAYYLLGDYASALRNLEDFDGGDFNGSQFDMRWGILPRARLLRAATYERIGRLDDARREYRQVLAQWKHADPALHPYLDQAGRGLVRLGEPPARLAALGYQLSANIADPKPGCSPPEAPGGRRGP